jgi:microcystin-dependent protein
MAGTIPLSMTQQFDVYGKPLAGGQLYMIQAGTVSTPQDAFQDLGLAIKMPYPMTLDAAGRVPQFFLADGTVKIRLQDKYGVVQLSADSVLVVGNSSGGGGGGGGSSVDPTQLMQTGNMILRYGVGPLLGYVRMNGLSIGSATSGAGERASADCQALFLYLWATDPNLVLYSGAGAVARQATALLDWTANRHLALPDWRGYAVGALDDLGSVPAGRLTAAFFGMSATVLGAVGGLQYNVLVADHMPPTGLSVSGTTGDDTPDHTHIVNAVKDAGNVSDVTPGAVKGNTINTDIVSSPPSVKHKHPFSANVVGGGGIGHPNVQPTKLCTLYLKL